MIKTRRWWHSFGQQGFLRPLGLFMVSAVMIFDSGRSYGGASTSQPAGPADAVSAFVAAIDAGDAAALERGLAATNADERTLKPAFIELCAALGSFHKAVHDVFPTAAGQWGVGGGPPGSIDVPPVLNPAAGVTAVLHFGAEKVDVPLVHEGAAWRLTFDGVQRIMKVRQIDGMTPTDEPLRRIAEMAEAVRKVAADVRDHHYPTPEAAADAGQHAFADAARGTFNQ